MEYQNTVHSSCVAMSEHRPNWQDWGGRWGFRIAFMCDFKTVLEDLATRSPSSHSSYLARRRPRRRNTNESDETLGNAGFFEATELGRDPSRGFPRAGTVSERSWDEDRCFYTVAARTGHT